MTPSAAILTAASTCQTIIDANGRRLTVRNLTALDRLRLFKAAGPTLAQNQPWLGMALIACSVVAIDDVPVPPPVTEVQIEALIGRLDDAGVSAIAHALHQATNANSQHEQDIAGN